MSGHQKQFYGAADRNKDPILSVLKETFKDPSYLDHTSTPRMKALEIASGTGQHLAHFAPHFPGVEWRPSENNESLLPSIHAYQVETSNMLPPWLVDIAAPPQQWPDLKDSHDLPQFDLILNINMVHIAPWEVCEGLFEAAGLLLKCGGLLMTYGPYASEGNLSPQSNRTFHESLQLQDPDWGIRDYCDLEEEATRNGLVIDQIHQMPANNKLLSWKKV